MMIFGLTQDIDIGGMLISYDDDCCSDDDKKVMMIRRRSAMVWLTVVM